MCNRTRREQHLIDLMFEIALKAYQWHKTNPNVGREDLTKWVRNALRDSGFDVSDPRGMSWGVLQSDRDLNTLSDTIGGIHIVSAERPD